MPNENDVLTLTDKAAVRTLLDAAERYMFDHLRNPDSPQDRAEKAVLEEITGQLTEFVHGRSV